jgi:cbb3-type cytochrome oxidase cytochrome c subunit
VNDIDAVIESAKKTMTWFFDAKLDDARRDLAERTEVLEKRVIAAEETSKAAIAQMTAVLAVLNVLAKYAGPPKGKP